MLYLLRLKASFKPNRNTCTPRCKVKSMKESNSPLTRKLVMLPMMIHQILSQTLATLHHRVKKAVMKRRKKKRKIKAHRNMLKPK